MKKHSILLLILCSGIYFFFSGCEKKDIYDAENQFDLNNSTSVFTQEGKLVFDNLDELFSFSDSLKSLPEDDYILFLEKMPEFNSYKNAYWKVIDQIALAKSEKQVFELINRNNNLVSFLESDTSVNEVFPTSSLSYTVDVNGQVIVGDSVGILTGDSFILLSKNEFDEMGSIPMSGFDKGTPIIAFKQIPTEHVYDNTSGRNDLLMGGNPSIPYAGITNNPSYVPSPGWYGTTTFYNKTFNNGIRRLKVEFQNLSINTTSYRVALTTTSYKRTLYVWLTAKHDRHFDVVNLSTGEPNSYNVKKNVKSHTLMFGGPGGIMSGMLFSVGIKVWTDYVHEHQGLNGSNQ